MRALDRKMWRELWRLRGPAAAIALVLACGVATFVMAFSTLDALLLTQSTFYEQSRFADLFASLKRAPEWIRPRLADVEGVDVVETRVKAFVKLEVEGFSDPITGQLVSIPEEHPPLLNDLHVRRGRIPEPYSTGEAVISDAFADAHGFQPGDRIGVIINGRRRSLTITGIVLSPETIYANAPGSVFPDFKRFGVLWMRRSALATAYGMEGAFNEVSVRLAPDAREEEVVARMDEILRPYGGLGTFGRDRQISHQYLSEEFKQLDQMATIWPIIFLGVAAFLLNVVVNRLVRTQREEIAVLKAFGYRAGDIMWHYTQLTLAIVAIGDLAGVAFGVWSGNAMGEMYMLFYRFPFLLYELKPEVVLYSVLICTVTALAGTFFAVREAGRLAPAVAMRPEPPANFHRTSLERLGLGKWMSQPARIIVRNMERTPVKTGLSILGIALSIAILVVGYFFVDAINYMMETQFGLIRREDVAVTLTEPTSERALFEMRRMEDVERVEGFRAVEVRIRHGQRSYRTSVLGLDPGGDLSRVLDRELQPIPLSSDGIVVTEYIGQSLRFAPGDTVMLEVLEGSRPVVRAKVDRLVRQFVGQGAYMEREALNRLLREGHVVNGAWMAVDEPRRTAVAKALDERPRVAGSLLTRLEMESFFETMGQNMLVFAFVMILFAGAIAFGVVYNSARISFAERAREMASLRVLGFTRGEIAYILVGELALLTLLALAPGCVLGWLFSAAMVGAFQSEIFYFPLVIHNASYATSALIVVGCAVVSSLVVVRRIRHLDLVEVLKTRE